MRRFLTSTFALFSVSAFAGNSLVNGGFEMGLVGWTNEGAAISPESSEGELGCMIHQDTPHWSGVSQMVAIPDGSKTVHVAGWLRSDSVRGGKGNWERGRLSVEFHDAKNDTVGGYPLAIGQVRGHQVWTRMARVVPIPTDAKSLKLECALANSTGTLYCDDLSVEFER